MKMWTCVSFLLLLFLSTTVVAALPTRCINLRFKPNHWKNSSSFYCFLCIKEQNMATLDLYQHYEQKSIVNPNLFAAAFETIWISLATPILWEGIHHHAYMRGQRCSFITRHRSRKCTGTVFASLVWPCRGSNPRLPTLEADVLPRNIWATKQS